MSQKKNASRKAIKDESGTMLDAAIYWGCAAGKMRGVFARRHIAKGEIVERAPVIPMSADNLPEEGAPDGYVLEWRDDEPGEKYALVLGYIMLYNHSENPNLHLENDFEGCAIEARALRDIAPGEELTWHYNCELWFTPV